MKMLAILVLMAALLAACDNSVPPTKASIDQNPKVDQNPLQKSATGGQLGMPPKQ